MAQSRKRLASLVLVTLWALATFAPGAQAHPDDTAAQATCVLAGVEGRTDGPGTPTIDSVEKDLDIDNSTVQDNGDQFWLFDLDSGGFVFEGDAICAVVDRGSRDTWNIPELLLDLQGGPNPTVVAGNGYAISAQGTFDNTVCLMDTTFNGQANLSGPALVDIGEPGTTTNIDFNFGIHVLLGIGLMELEIDGGNVGHNVVTGGKGSGEIHFRPTLGSCATGHGVQSFEVNGAFETSLTGDGGVGG